MLDAKLRERKGSVQGSYPDLYQQEYSASESKIRTVEYGKDLLIVMLPSFMFDDNAANKVTSTARKYQTVILDVRENTGGAVSMLQAMVGGLFDHDVKISDRVARDSTTPMVAKASHHSFEGKVIVLVDSKSASALRVASADNTIGEAWNRSRRPDLRQRDGSEVVLVRRRDNGGADSVRGIPHRRQFGNVGRT